MQAGADLFATNQQLETALHVASRQHNVDATAFIISAFQAKGPRQGQGARTRMAGRPDGMPAIQWRNFVGQNALMLALDWDDALVFPRTAEYITERRRRLHTVACMLLDAGIGPNHVDYTGEQPLSPSAPQPLSLAAPQSLASCLSVDHPHCGCAAYFTNVNYAHVY